MGLLNLKEVANRLGVDRRTLYGAIAQGTIRAVQLNKFIYVSEAEVARILAPGDNNKEVAKHD